MDLVACARIHRDYLTLFTWRLGQNLHSMYDTLTPGASPRGQFTLSLTGTNFVNSAARF